MKPVGALNFGFGDAENYRRKENKEIFNTIFVKNEFLDKLLDSSVYFLIGEKGTAAAPVVVENRFFGIHA